MMAVSSQLLGEPSALTRASFAVPLGTSFGVTVSMWASASGCAPTTQDAWLIAAQRDRVRIAALDGITPTAATPATEGLDGAAWAARVTAAMLELPVEAREALRRANRQLLARPGVDSLPHRSRPHTMAAVADLELTGTEVALRLTLAGDCQMFVEDDAGWHERCGGSIVTDAAALRWIEWLEANPGVDPLEGIIEAYEEFSASPDSWRTSPIGLFAEPVLVDANIAAGGWRRVIVASDGAQLTAQRCADLDRWLSNLRAHELDTASGEFKPHDDVVVLQAELDAG